MKKIIGAINDKGEMTAGEITEAVQALYLIQTTLYEMDEDDFREAVEEGMNIED